MSSELEEALPELPSQRGHLSTQGQLGQQGQRRLAHQDEASTEDQPDGHDAAGEALTSRDDVDALDLDATRRQLHDEGETNEHDQQHGHVEEALQHDGGKAPTEGHALRLVEHVGAYHLAQP